MPRPFIQLGITPNPASSAYTRFRAWVDLAVANKPGYGFSAADAGWMWLFTGDVKYATLAIAHVEAHVVAAEAAIATGQRPKVANDSYLHVGDNIGDLARIYDWCYDLLTESQRQRWAAYADQTINNVWNYTAATWGGVAYPWTGWSTSNPGNNYHYSFLEATMTWALASENQAWLTFLRTVKLPPLTAYFQNLPGGGSLEGTGYGSSHMRLFELYRIWKLSTGEDLAAQSAHCRDSIDYWCHVTVPSRDRFAPIGDQSRDSTAQVYDYQRRIVLEATAVNIGTPEAGRGAWWLANSIIPIIGTGRMSAGFNYRWDLLATADAPVAPTALAYHALGVGELFARTDWTTDATWFAVKVGKYAEGHAHQDQGSFLLYRKGWAAYDEVIHTHSGIKQDTMHHNMVRFDKAGVPVRQDYGSTATMGSLDALGVLAINADLTPCYAKNRTAVQSWRRALTFDRVAKRLTIHDEFAVGAGVTPVWQLQTPTQPTIIGDRVVFGEWTLATSTPGAVWSVVDWRTLNATEYKGGWRIELRAPGNSFDVVLYFGTEVFSVDEINAMLAEGQAKTATAVTAKDAATAAQATLTTAKSDAVAAMQVSVDKMQAALALQPALASAVATLTSLIQQVNSL